MKFTHNNRWQVPGTRRSFLSDCGMGMTGMVLGSLLAKDGISRANAAAVTGPAAALIPRLPVIAPKARSVIWLFMIGGTSQMESFDPKPDLNRYQGKSIDRTPFKATLDSPYLKTNLRELSMQGWRPLAVGVVGEFGIAVLTLAMVVFASRMFVF